MNLRQETLVAEAMNSCLFGWDHETFYHLLDEFVFPTVRQ